MKNNLRVIQLFKPLLIFIFIPPTYGLRCSGTDTSFFLQCSSHLYIALRQFLTVFPELRRAPFYLAGESYAGRYIPALGVKILEQDRNIGLLDINLQVMFCLHLSHIQILIKYR